jgi:hypothetical protein
LPEATTDISVVEKTTFNGKIHDDTGAPLDGVTVTAKSLNASVPYEATTTSAGGAYAFNNGPAGVQVEIRATKAGFTKRRRVEVLKSNKQGDPNANKYDFGSSAGGALDTALSDKPEVETATPTREASGVDPKTSFVFKFSEPVDRKSVEDAFSVSSFSDAKFSVDGGLTDPNITFRGSKNISTITNSTFVWDKNAFTITWNSTDDEVTFAFKEEKRLPADKDAANTPQYQIGFANNGNNALAAGQRLKDKALVERTNNYFKMTDGFPEETYKIAVNTDTVRPEVASLSPQTVENNSLNGDAIRVIYSEPMIFYTKVYSIAGGLEDRKNTAAVTAGINKAPAEHPCSVATTGTNSFSTGYVDTCAASTLGGGRNVTSRATAANYRFKLASEATDVRWSDLGGKAVYDTNDVTFKTVILLPPQLADGTNMLGESTNAGLNYAADIAGDTVTVTLLPFNTSAANVAVTTAALTMQAANSARGISDVLTSALNTAFLNNANTNGSAGAGGVRPTVSVADAGSDTVVANTGIIRFRFTQTNGNRLYRLAVLSYNDADAMNATGATTGLGTGASQSNVASDRADFFKPGDSVKVTVETTVVDPAGNTIDSTKNNATANAS